MSGLRRAWTPKESSPSCRRPDTWSVGGLRYTEVAWTGMPGWQPVLPECPDAGSCQLVALTWVLGLHLEHWIERVDSVDRIGWLHLVGRLGGLDLVGRVGRLAGVGVLGRLAGLGIVGRLGCQRRLDPLGAFPLVDPGLAVGRARPDAPPPAALAG
jgi:hypothetical protein